jgi:4-hydroxybenzoate polyprenyltransferase
MTALQFGIGATNDVVDAGTDAGHKPGKPIPAGLVSPGGGRVAAGVAFAAGLVLAAGSGVAVFALAVLVIAIGLAYDLRLKGTAWSWLPFAAGIPILPVFGWLGATGEVPPAFAILVPAAVLAGAALAISNSIADLERDRAAGIQSIALALGQDRAWLAHVVLLAIVVVAAVASAALMGGPEAGPAVLVAVTGVVPLAGAAIGWSGGPGRRERAWEIEALGVALTGIVWTWVVLGP